jgi:hypothetical protein
MLGDALWLSPSHGNDRVGIHFSWLREPYAVQTMTAEIEGMLRHSAGVPIGARSFMPAHSSSHRFIQRLPAFEDSSGR